MNIVINEYKKLNYIFGNNKKNTKIKNKTKIAFCFLIFLLFLYANYYFIFNQNILNKKFLLRKEKNNNTKTIIGNSINLTSIKEDFNDTFIQKYLILQKYFCENQIIFNNTLLEANLRLAKAHFDNIKFNMFVYSTNDIVSNSISIKGNWEYFETKNLLSSLDYYSEKKNISKNDIYILDIGANIGWFSLLLGKIGYNIISFEPSKLNYYILLKNYCINKEINLTIINKGLDNTERIWNLYIHKNNIGNAMTFSDLRHLNSSLFIKQEIQLSKLENYITYLKSKNLAIIKLDIEGSEVKALEGGIDLIVKYHVPFILMEWTPKVIKEKGTEPRSFLVMLENNGYKISKIGFLSKKYISIEELINQNQLNIYIIYHKFLD